MSHTKLTQEELELREIEEARNKARLESQDIETPKSVVDAKIPEAKPMSTAQVFGMGEGGPYYVSIPYMDELTQKMETKQLQLCSFTLKTQPRVSKLLGELPSVVNLAIVIWSRTPIGQEPNVKDAIETCRLTMDQDNADLADESFIGQVMHGAPMLITEDVVDSIVEILHLSLSRYATWLKQDFISENIDSADAIRIIGNILHINPGLSERFFGLCRIVPEE